ncbi:MAG: 4-hydroxythreonine-4-phosphate dehydrogenase PdxA, partial [Pseudomonadales bacterium]
MPHPPSKKADSLPRLAITQGDPAGIGPEVIVKALADKSVYQYAQPVVIGSPSCLEEAMHQTGIKHELKLLDSVADVREQPDLLQVVDPAKFNASDCKIGQVSAACGQASVRYFEAAVQNCLSGHLDGVVTCPINKEAVQAAGYHEDLGHQEILARMTGSELTATLLMTDKLKVAHLSTHKSLAAAVAYVKKPILVEKLKL